MKLFPSLTAVLKFATRESMKDFLQKIGNAICSIPFHLCYNDFVNELCNGNLSWYLLQMRTFGKVASLIGSVEETRLVDTVEVVNCSTVLVRRGRVKSNF